MYLPSEEYRDHGRCTGTDGVELVHLDRRVVVVFTVISASFDLELTPKVKGEF